MARFGPVPFRLPSFPQFRDSHRADGITPELRKRDRATGVGKASASYCSTAAGQSAPWSWMEISHRIATPAHRQPKPRLKPFLAWDILMCRPRPPEWGFRPAKARRYPLRPPPSRIGSRNAVVTGMRCPPALLRGTEKALRVVDPISIADVVGRDRARTDRLSAAVEAAPAEAPGSCPGRADPCLENVVVARLDANLWGQAGGRDGLPTVRSGARKEMYSSLLVGPPFSRFTSPPGHVWKRKLAASPCRRRLGPRENSQASPKRILS